MTITNQTLMWLAPLAGAVAMTVTTMTTRWIDNRRPRKEPDVPETNRAYRLAREAAGDAVLAAIDAAIGAAPDATRVRGGPEPKVRSPEVTHRP